VTADGLDRRVARRLIAEFVGSALLVAIVVGSGIAAERLSPTDVGVQLLENSLTTALGLGVLILVFSPVSGAHFNPVVSLVDWLLCRRSSTGMNSRRLWLYTAVQILGAIAGAMLANAMFDRRAVEIATKERLSTGHLIAEVVATSGLIAVIFTLARTGRTGLSAAAVGSYIGAAYWFTSSTSFANPAVTIGRVFSDTFAGIAPASVAPFIAAQIVGAFVGLALTVYLYPDDARVRRTNHSTHGADMSKPAVLFLCTHNAGRSQMAMGFFKHFAGEQASVYSGGSEPAQEVNPAAIKVMAEKGIDMATEQPKRWTPDMLEAADVVITMGCGDTCPIQPGRRYEDWAIPDPAGLSVDDVRPIRDNIEKRVQALLGQLGVSPGGTGIPPA
jgi:arsenate reductase